MDLEQLTKHQIVLLTLLVSFVTSIATGIVTVALMDQAPDGVTRVVNQIVERTVETVVPEQPAAVAAVTEKIVYYVNNDDLAAKSIASVQKGIIRIVSKGGASLIARGVLTSSTGSALTDRAALVASGAREFEAILASGERVPLTVPSLTAGTSSIVRVDVQLGTSTGTAPVKLGDVRNVALGQRVIRIGGVGSDTVGEGVVATLPSLGESTIPETVAASVSSATPGSILFTLSGEVIGLTTAQSAQSGSEFYTVPAESISLLPTSRSIE